MPATPASEFSEALPAKVIDPGSTGRISSSSAQTPGSGVTKYLSRMAVRTEHRIVLVSLHDVVWIQSHGNFLRLHLQGATYLHRMTIQDICSQLDPERFLRIHRTAVVNLDHVVEFALPRRGAALVYLHSGIALPISRARRPELRRGLLSHAWASPWAAGI